MQCVERRLNLRRSWAKLRLSFGQRAHRELVQKLEME
jgi:hypothetical protein